jgi:hypothetical protein
MLAERDHREAARRLARRPLLDGGGERALERCGRRGPKAPPSAARAAGAGEIADRERGGERVALAPQRAARSGHPSPALAEAIAARRRRASSASATPGKRSSWSLR